MIAIFYTGARRHPEVTKQNHEYIISKIKEKYPVTIYDHQQPEFNRTGCNFTISGGVQVWDFIKSCEIIKEDIVVKFRSDVWFTDSSISVILEQIDEVVDNKVDVAYLGYDFRNHYDKKCYKIDADQLKKVVDFIVVARKDKITTMDRAIEKIVGDSSKNGNALFRNIRKEGIRSVNVSCHLYLVRNHFDNPNHYDILTDWVKQYRITGGEWDWVINNKDLIIKEY